MQEASLCIFQIKNFWHPFKHCTIFRGSLKNMKIPLPLKKSLCLKFKAAYLLFLCAFYFILIRSWREGKWRTFLRLSFIHLCNKFDIFAGAGYHSFSIYAKFYEKLTFFATCTHMYQGVRKVSFSENFAYILNEWIP